jgi:hypothetical protein
MADSRTWRCAVVVLGLGCLLVGCPAGCGGCAELQKVPTVPVAGRVTLDGQPVPYGLVYFHPDRERGNVSPYTPLGRIEEGGSYHLFTRPNRGEGLERWLAAMKRGAPPGWYKVEVIAIERFDEDQHGLKNPRRGERQWLIPRRYANAETSGLRLQVVADAAPGAYDLRLRE